MSSSKLCVWHVITNRWYSAISEYSLRLALACKENGIESIMSPLAGSPLERNLIQKGLEVRPLPSTGLSGWIRFKQISQEINPGVVVAYGGPESLYCAFLKRESGLQKYRFKGDRRSLGKLSPFLLNKMDGIFFPAKAVSDSILDLRLDLKSSVVPFASDSRLDQHTKIERYDRPTLLLVARFDPVKGHGAFFDLFRKIKDSWPSNRPRPRLLVVGHEANLSTKELIGLASSSGLEIGDDIEVVDQKVPNIRELMAACHVGVVASIDSESICRVGVEYLLAGLPVITTGVGALPELRNDHGDSQVYTEMNVDKIRVLIWESYNEKPTARYDRSLRASKRFSYDSMFQGFRRLVTALH